jgi:YMGG-like Gly-zipper
MTQYIRHGQRVAALFVLATIVACSGQKDDSALLDDTTLGRDLARVEGDTALQPQLQDVPAETPPATTPPRTTTRPKTTPTQPKTTPVAPQPAPGTTKSGNVVEKGTGTAEGGSGVIAAGTTMRLDAANKVCTNTNKIGDRFTATVSEAVTGTNGVSIPSGADVTLELTELKRSENANDQIVMGFRVVNVSFGGKTYPLQADVQSAVIDRVRSSSGSDDAKKVVGGAVAGAIIGQVLGRNRKGTLIGAAAGAAAGGAAAAATGNYEGCVNAGADIVLRLTSPVTVTT